MIFKNLCAVDAQGADASLSKLSYLAGGAVTTFVMVWHTTHDHDVNWPFTFLFIGFLAYHLGPHAFKQFLDKLPGTRPGCEEK